MGAVNYIVHVKNMVCPRCLNVVRDLLEDLGYTVIAVDLGQAVIKSQGNPVWHEIRERLSTYGFRLLNSETEQETERIRNLLIHLFYFRNHPVKVGFPATYLELAMNRDLQELDRLFESVHGQSIAEYINRLRFERAKELISYHEQSVEDIAYKLGYNNADELKNEFRERLNITISEFLNESNVSRKSLDKLV